MAIDKLYRRQEVEEMTGLSRSTIYHLMDKGEFLRPVKITGKCVAWPESYIKSWIDNLQE